MAAQTPNMADIGDGCSNINTSNVPSNQKQNNKTTTTNVPPNQTQNNNDSNNWIRNLSKTPLTQAQEQVLSHGPNLAIVAKEPPIGEYVAQVEKVCQQLKQGEVEELRGEIKSILKKILPPKSNITKEEAKAIQELKKDTDRIILTTDKEVSMVVIDKEEYIKKSEELLSQSSYKVLPSDPTTKHKNKPISLLKTIKAEGGINDTTYRRLYPTGQDPPNIMVCQKYIKKGCH